jgi:MoaA/NifB/PqqE/SkfB family radical SAM enzyme
MSQIKVCSFHFTKECNMRCSFCYIKGGKKAKPLSFWKTLPKTMSDIGIEQCAIGGGEPLLYPKFLKTFTNDCFDYGIICNMTTNGTLINEKNLKGTKFELISISRDAEKLNFVKYNSKLYFSYYNNARIIKKLGIKTGLNWLVSSEQDFFVLQNFLQSQIEYEAYLQTQKETERDTFDNLYVLQMKNVPGLTEQLKPLLKLLPLLKRNLYFDDAYSLDLGIKENCSRGNELISIHPDGSIRPCSFSDPIGTLSKPEDLKDIVKSIYPLEKTTKCPFVVRR